MKSSFNSLRYKFSKLFRLHQAFVITVVVLLLLLTVLLRINSLSNKPVDQSYINKKSAELKTVKFDQKAIEKIKTLRESNVAVPQTELPSNRQNPFNE